MSIEMMTRSLLYPIDAKTADYTVVAQDIGKILTNRAATASVTFTLPIVTEIQAGWWCMFFAAADFAVVIASAGSLDNLTTFNDLTADSITIDTATEIIGAGVKVVWDGTGWLVHLFPQETQTVTVA